VFKFRPSGHSDDYTIFANYRSDVDAIKAKKAVEQLLADIAKNTSKYTLDWSVDEAKLSICGEEVSFSVNTAGYLNEVEAALRKSVEPKSVKCRVNHQELQISVKMPVDLSLQSAMLVLDVDEVKAIAWLIEKVGSPNMSKTAKEDDNDGDSGEQVWVWYYAGEGLWDGDCLYLDFEFDVSQRSNWKVSCK